MSNDSEYLTTKEVAELLRIKERKVYDMAAEQLIPCTRATGKLLFSRIAVDRWLKTHSTGVDASGQQVPMLFAGSHDPLLEWTVRESQCGIPTLFDGSVDGLDRVLSGGASLSAVHIYSPTEKQWNIPAVSERVQTESVVLSKWVTRQRGFMVRRGLGLSDVRQISNYKVVLRQATAGSQLLFEQLLAENALSVADLDVALVVRSETDAALAISQGRADCALGLESVAELHNLEFLPLMQESLDLLVDRRFWFEAPMQKFIGFCGTETFRSQFKDLRGYNASDMFEVLYNS